MERQVSGDGTGILSGQFGVGSRRTGTRPIPAVQAAISISRKQSVSSGPSNVDNGVGSGLSGFVCRYEVAAVGGFGMTYRVGSEARS